MGRGASEPLSVGFAVSLLGRMFRPDFCLDPVSSVAVKQAESICCLHGAWASRWPWSIWPASQTNGDGPSEGLPPFTGLCFQGTAEIRPHALLASLGGPLFHAWFGFSRSNLRP